MTKTTEGIAEMIACHCPVGSLGHEWNPSPGWCPNPQVGDDDA